VNVCSFIPARVSVPRAIWLGRFVKRFMNHLSSPYLYQCNYLLILGVITVSWTDQGNNPTFLACSWSCEGEEVLTVARSSWAEATNDCIDCKRTATPAASVRRSRDGE
jgi:hypothetical protein